MGLNDTVMKYDNTELSFENRMREEYEEAKKDGFEGTYEEYIELRDYT